MTDEELNAMQKWFDYEKELSRPTADLFENLLDEARRARAESATLKAERDMLLAANARMEADMLEAQTALAVAEKDADEAQEQTEEWAAEARRLLGAVAAIEKERDAYRGALGYSVPGDHDGRLLNGKIPFCGFCDAAGRRHAEVLAAERAKALEEAADCVKHLSHEDGLGMGSLRLERAIRALGGEHRPAEGEKT